MTLPIEERIWWDIEARADTRYATRAWGGDGTPETVQSTIDAIIFNLTRAIFHLPGSHSGRSLTIVELGCGSGRLLHRFARVCPDDHVIGLDISQKMLDLATDDIPDNVELQLIDGRNIPVDGIDFIYTVEVFQHLNDETKVDYLAQMYESIKPGGLVVVQYVVNGEEPTFMSYPTTEAFMKGAAKSIGFKLVPAKTFRPNPVHADVWRWLVMTK